MISIVVAASRNGVIGVDGDLPWRLPDDLRYFKQLTTGKPVVMGRKTYESIGRPLPNRQNIVITRNPVFEAPGCDVVSSPEEALRAAGNVDEVMVIGGGTIYEQFAGRVDRIYLTSVHTEIDGDVFFEAPDSSLWRQAASTHHPADERHQYAFDFQTFERRSRE